MLPAWRLPEGDQAREHLPGRQGGGSPLGRSAACPSNEGGAACSAGPLEGLAERLAGRRLASWRRRPAASGGLRAPGRRSALGGPPRVCGAPDPHAPPLSRRASGAIWAPPLRRVLRRGGDPSWSSEPRPARRVAVSARSGLVPVPLPLVPLDPRTEAPEWGQRHPPRKHVLARGIHDRKACRLLLSRDSSRSACGHSKGPDVH